MEANVLPTALGLPARDTKSRARVGSGCRAISLSNPTGASSSEPSLSISSTGSIPSAAARARSVRALSTTAGYDPSFGGCWVRRFELLPYY
ncbi:hypothetical protein A0H81_13706 [Grifola frondosa]|uniref:Uncharacterized protein n=1 Tax=Grifola frondosa TaxID=5627 RepID=A0A1C7LQS8_GRIFR|nr:hypothetical protein A0H81_13706 [Grifola frondosa]